MATQKSEVLNHLLTKGTITSWEAISAYRITRLAAIIHLLRKQGLIIKSIDRSSCNKNWTEYVYKGMIIPNDLKLNV